MPGIDPDRLFIPVKIALMTVSDTRTSETDRSGDVLESRALAAGHEVSARTIVRDDRRLIAAQLRAWIADDGIDVVLSTGGTGLTGRDVTPEAFADVWEKPIPGFGELFRWQSYQKIGTSTIQGVGMQSSWEGNPQLVPWKNMPSSSRSQKRSRTKESGRS